MIKLDLIHPKGPRIIATPDELPRLAKENGIAEFLPEGWIFHDDNEVAKRDLLRGGPLVDDDGNYFWEISHPTFAVIGLDISRLTKQVVWGVGWTEAEAMDRASNALWETGLYRTASEADETVIAMERTRISLVEAIRISDGYIGWPQIETKMQEAVRSVDAIEDAEIIEDAGKGAGE